MNTTLFGRVAAAAAAAVAHKDYYVIMRAKRAPFLVSARLHSPRAIASKSSRRLLRTHIRHLGLRNRARVGLHTYDDDAALLTVYSAVLAPVTRRRRRRRYTRCTPCDVSQRLDTFRMFTIITSRWGFTNLTRRSATDLCASNTHTFVKHG